MNYEELMAWMQQQAPLNTEGVYDPVTGTSSMPTGPQMYDLGNGTYAAPMPDGRIRVLTSADGQGVSSGYDLYRDGRQEPWGTDKSASTWDQIRSVATPLAAFGLAGAGLGAAGLLGGSGAAGLGAADAAALASADAGMAGFGGAGAGTAAGAAGTAAGMSPEIAAAMAGAGDAGAMGGVTSGLTAGTAAVAPAATTGGFDPLKAGAALLGAGAGIAGNEDINNQSSSNSSSSTSLAPWLQSYAQDYVGRAQQLASAPTSNPAMDAGRGLLTNYATQGDPLVNAARAQQQNVINGGMLNSNPYIDAVAGGIGNRMADAFKRGTAANTDAVFARNRAFGGSAWDEQQGANSQAFNDSVGQTMRGLYFGNYANERNAQDAAARGSLQFGQFATNNAQNLYNTGSQDWQRPFYQNAQYGAAIQPAFGSQTQGTGTQTGTVQAPNNWQAGVGGALAGLSLYRMI